MKEVVKEIVKSVIGKDDVATSESVSTARVGDIEVKPVIKVEPVITVEINNPSLQENLPLQVVDLYKTLDKGASVLSNVKEKQSELTIDPPKKRKDTSHGAMLRETADEALADNRIEDALQHYEECAKFYGKENKDFERATVLARMSILANIQKKHKVESPYIAKESRFRNTALLLYIKALVSGKYDKFTPQEFIGLGELESRIGNYDNALAYYEIAKEFSENTENYQALANVLRLIGIMEGKAERGGRAIGNKYFAESRSIYIDIEDDFGIARTYEAQGDMERGHEDYENAIAHYKEAWAIYKAAGDARMYFIAWHFYDTYKLAENVSMAQYWKEEIDKMLPEMPKQQSNFVLGRRNIEKKKTESQDSES
ncbi:MAG: tetratricopeptide repeat protein [Oscillospiraceae bacterium]|nr:tetratricopeptide repeat protein [Oscillospiraceae bacterium]